MWQAKRTASCLDRGRPGTPYIFRLLKTPVPERTRDRVHLLSFNI